MIAGLGNPGVRYEATRHNVGADWLQRLAVRFGVPLRAARKFKGLVGRGDILGHDLRLLLPTTYVNLSGQAVAAMARFYKIDTDQVLVAYDEVAFPVGVCRLKTGGGHNGHNGLKSIIGDFAGDRRFARLRIGIGHPGNADDMVAYLTGVTMPAAERDAAAATSFLDDETLALVLDGDWQKAMNVFHARPPQG